MCSDIHYKCLQEYNVYAVSVMQILRKTQIIFSLVKSSLSQPEHKNAKEQILTKEPTVFLL